MLATMFKAILVTSLTIAMASPVAHAMPRAKAKKAVPAAKAHSAQVQKPQSKLRRANPLRFFRNRKARTKTPLTIKQNTRRSTFWYSTSALSGVLTVGSVAAAVYFAAIQFDPGHMASEAASPERIQAGFNVSAASFGTIAGLAFTFSSYLFGSVHELAAVRQKLGRDE